MFNSLLKAWEIKTFIEWFLKTKFNIFLFQLIFRNHGEVARKYIRLQHLHCSWSTILFYLHRVNVNCNVIIWRRLSPRTPGPPWQTSKVEMPGSEERKHSVLGTLHEFRAFSTRQAPRPPARSRDTNRTLSSKSQNSEYISITCMKTNDL